MDEYGQPGSWKDVIYEQRMMVDAEGFQYKYVPKDNIITDDHLRGKGGKQGKRERKGTDNSGYIYLKKH